MPPSSSDKLLDAFNEHSLDDHKQFEAIHETLRTIKGNDLFHIHEAVTSIASDVKELATDVKEVKTGLSKNTVDTSNATVNIGWIMKIGGVVGTAIIVGLVGLFFKGL